MWLLMCTTAMAIISIPLLTSWAADFIIHTYIAVQSIDTSVSSSSGTLHIDSLTGATYQWLNCDAGSTIISGATSAEL
jgi:hypothetical protein